MSRSNNTDLVNPAKKFLKWSEKSFSYYDKAEEKNVEMPLPFTFVVLDTLISIAGYNDNEKSGYWSNEIRDLKKEELVVRSKGGICAKGLYESVIKDRECVGAKFCQSVYIAYFEGKNLAIGNIRLTGAALGAWFDFKKANDIYKGAVSVKEFTSDKKGRVEYTMPVFTSVPLSEETNELAIALDVELQEYFKAYFHERMNVNAELKEEQNAKVIKPEGNVSLYPEAKAKKEPTFSGSDINDLPWERENEDAPF